MIPAIVLAAGRSQRMGQPKLLLPIQGQPLLVRVVDALLTSPAEPVYVVVGPAGEPLRIALGGRRVDFVINPHGDGEMLDSVRCGLRALPRESEAAVVALGDQPGITADLVARLLHAFHRTGRGLVVPVCNDRRGHPLLIATRYREEILTQHSGRGLRGLLEAHPRDVCELPVDTPDIFQDIDLPEDYQQLLARYHREH